MLRKLFKNYKSKRELREEIARLEGELNAMRFTPVISVEREIMTLRESVTMNMVGSNVPPIKHYKRQVARLLVTQLENRGLINWDITDEYGQSGIRRCLVGEIKIAVQKSINGGDKDV